MEQDKGKSMFEMSKQKIRLLAGDKIIIKSLSENKCFWTWPFGHVWGKHENGANDCRRCIVCQLMDVKGWVGGEWLYDMAPYFKTGLVSKYPIGPIIKRYIVAIIIIILIGIGIGIGVMF